jgi:hypothetical protein
MAANETTAGWAETARMSQTPSFDRGHEAKATMPVLIARWLERRLRDATVESVVTIWSDEDSVWIRHEQGASSSTVGFAARARSSISEWSHAIVREGSRQGELRVSPSQRG